MRIIPAIDIINGQCVRLTKGDYSTQKVYNEKPLEVAKMFEAAGIKYLHLVDLDGAKAKQIINYKVLEEIASKTNLQIDFGGGIKSAKDFEIAFNCGAKQVTAGSLAVTAPNLFVEALQKYGTDKIILGADFRNRKIAVSGWLQDSELDVIQFINSYIEIGISYAICTDISKDGMLQGISAEIYKEILSETKAKLIASGGVSCLADVIECKELGCEGVIIGKAIYEGKILLKELYELEH